MYDNSVTNLAKSKNNSYICFHLGDAASIRLLHKRESGQNPEQYPLLCTPFQESHPLQCHCRADGKAAFSGKSGNLPKL